MSRIWVRGSHLGIRVFAVALLVLGIGAGVTTGLLRDGGADTLTVEPQAEAVTVRTVPTPSADTDRPQAVPVGARLLAVKRQQAVVAAAQARARAKAAAARTAAAERAARAAAERASRSTTRAATETSGPNQPAPAAPVDCQQYTGNRRTGCSLLSWAGFSTSQFSCLDKLFQKESGWNERASNGGSGAYGIPQALPGDKMAAYGPNWRTDPVVQIKWGLNYIKGRYGTPCNAWSHSVSTGWY